jgi:hypothetical protein
MDNQNINLDFIKVRPIKSSEEKTWNLLMSSHHYLGFRILVGESIKYVATYGEDGQWVALIGWGAPAFKNCFRDNWIGWTDEQQWKRLKYIANNLRFLILPGIQVKNLASKVLSLNLKRISDDWNQFYGHSIVLVETFVDDARYKGTCYKANGWSVLGKTKGFGRNGGKYFFHGQVKTIFIKPLRKDTQKLLTSTFLHKKLRKDHEMDVDMNQINIEKKEGLLERLIRIDDPRGGQGKLHSLASVLAIAVCANFAGMRNYQDIAQWGQSQSQEVLEKLGCRYDYEQVKIVAPSKSTVRRVLMSIDADQLDVVIGEWLVEQFEIEAIAIDGKTLKGARNENGKPVHLLAAVIQNAGAVISQKKVSEKSNEITAAQPLLENLNVEGKIITADAMHTQKNFANFLVDKKKPITFSP